mmetsp:Transcript_10337/g.20345  ORF Transcript_10337/g.20345 Transcript_10337/m.20345 type:complete len:304 (-) Transcript_10337:235-1146(-)|eukprot:CAMPEP_0171489678 /NCGR_PEP_ID=MMETSP0958-20121227/2896_1 /TAXON_ID=87120 /ORGANISM="Aurantiochytrium limacinum, Strain ATCCMYA-1381" /LENGTH=303 /DNA_ID=CAMNT_0012022929 /DNA_START=116 /DNA_END=1027 /DNA_ORIENTATION=-
MSKAVRNLAPGKWRSWVTLSSESSTKRIDNNYLRFPVGAAGRIARAELIADASKVVDVIMQRALNAENATSAIDKHLYKCIGLPAKTEQEIKSNEGFEEFIMSMGVSVCDDETIADLNAEDRGIPEPTDVLSYPTFAMRGDEPGANLIMQGRSFEAGMFNEMNNNDNELLDLEKMSKEEEEFLRELEKFETDDLEQYVKESSEYAEGVDGYAFDDGHPIEKSAAYLGDVIISIDTAERQAAERGHSVRQELRILLVHSVLHLSLFDHETKKDMKLMRAAEAEVIKELGWDIAKGLVSHAHGEE